ncbi:MAG: serine/threonine-protein phosphatase [Prevotella sp.]|nr:serine/threonine-protein phosphatase [Prevotella sp.]
MVMEQRAEILQGLNRHEEAAVLYQELYLLSDSLNAQDTKEQLNEMNTMYQLDEKAMENERLQMEKERDQFRFIIIVVAVVLLSLAIFLFFRIRAARKLKQAHGELQVAYDDLQAANEVIEETTAAKERIESELRIARDIQMSMVPNVFPERSDLDLFASMTPAKEVGGDLYNFLVIGDKLYFALGDVSGKGVPASLFMAQATRLFRTLAKQQLQPAEIATRMNDELGEDNEQGMFVTMFLGLVDLPTGHLDFCNAGHNPPAIGTDGHFTFLEMEPNAPIGLWPGLEYIGEELSDIREQPLFVYTDGLNEAENTEQEQFSDEKMLDILNGHPFNSAQQTIEMLVDAVEQHRNGADPNDDLTMICLKVKKLNN